MYSIEEIQERLANIGRGSEENIAKQAKSSFADHELREMSKEEDFARVFLCSRRDTNRYYFYVIVWPGCLVVRGDVGGLMVARCQDMIDWCRKAVNYPEDFFSKADPISQIHKVFREVKFEAWLKDAIENDEEQLWTDQRIVDIFNLVEDGQNSSIDRITEFLMDEEIDPDAWELWDTFADYKPCHWWSLEAVKKFVELYDKEIKERNENKDTPQSKDNDRTAIGKAG